MDGYHEMIILSCKQESPSSLVMQIYVMPTLHYGCELYHYWLNVKHEQDLSAQARWYRISQCGHCDKQFQDKQMCCHVSR